MGGENARETGPVADSMTAFDMLRQENTREHAEIKGLLTAQNGRVRKLELWRSYVLGAVAAVLVMASVGWLDVSKRIRDLKQERVDAVQAEDAPKSAEAGAARLSASEG